METKDELLVGFHRQFAENQNHHQKLFIQFLSAVIIVIAGYFIVYVEVTNDIIEKKYTVDHIKGVYILVQFILILMQVMILNMGYNFRRDQKVNYNIRHSYLKEKYSDIFGFGIPFEASNKHFLSYQPGFNMILFVGLLFFQIILFLSLYNEKIVNSVSCKFLFFIPTIVGFMEYVWFWGKYFKNVKIKSNG